MEIAIKELNSREEMMSSFSLINQMYEKITKEEFCAVLDEMILRNDYKMVAVFLGEKMIGVSGYWIASMFYCGRYLQASNLVVDRNNRKNGAGRKLLNYLKAKAKEFNCKKFVLDSYVENKKSHSLFFRENFYIRGFHFMMDL